MFLKKIDYYVLRHFIAWFFVCLVGLMGLYVMIDIFLRLHNFFKFPTEEIPWRILSFYLWNVPFNFLEYVPLVTLMAGMFTVAMMAKANELVPIVASGVSVYRISANIFGCAAIVMFGMFAVQEWFLPAFSDSIASATDKPLNEALSIRDLKVDRFGMKIFHYRNFDNEKEQMNGVTITQLDNDRDYREAAYIYADSARIGDAERLTKTNGAVLVGFEHTLRQDETLYLVDDMLRIIKLKDIKSRDPLTLTNGTVINGAQVIPQPNEVLFRNGSWASLIPLSEVSKIEKVKTWILSKGVCLDYVRMTRGDNTNGASHPWQFKFDDYEMAFDTNLEVKNLRVKPFFEPRFESLASLNKYINLYPAYDTWKVALYRRIALPLTNLILLLVGLPFVMRMDKKSVFVSLGICILIFLGFFVLSFICNNLGEHKQMPAALSVAMPLIVFMAIGLYKFDSMRT